MTRASALIIGGGIGGLAAALALRRMGVEAKVFEKAPRIAEVGAGLSLWSNAVTALRRLGLEQHVLAQGSVIKRARTVLPSGKVIGALDLDALGRSTGAASLCIERPRLQQILLAAVLDDDRDAVQTGRDCVGFEEDSAGISALFSDGSRERGDLLVGADGIHSATRRRLFGDEPVRAAGYFAWRGIARDTSPPLGEGEVLFALGRGTQAACFPCGEASVYWFATRNGSAGATEYGAKAAAIEAVGDWQTPIRSLIEKTGEAAILCNDIIDRPARPNWGAGRVTLLGDAIHATTPNLGQGACQALEDAVVLADAVRRSATIDSGLRDYEARRRQRARFVIDTSWRLGRVLQWANPLATWLRDSLSATSWARKHEAQVFGRLLHVDLPELRS